MGIGCYSVWRLALSTNNHEIAGSRLNNVPFWFFSYKSFIIAPLVQYKIPGSIPAKSNFSVLQVNDSPIWGLRSGGGGDCNSLGVTCTTFICASNFWRVICRRRVKNIPMCTFYKPAWCPFLWHCITSTWGFNVYMDVLVFSSSPVGVKVKIMPSECMWYRLHMRCYPSDNKWCNHCDRVGCQSDTSRMAAQSGSTQFRLTRLLVVYHQSTMGEFLYQEQKKQEICLISLFCFCFKFWSTCFSVITDYHYSNYDVMTKYILCSWR